MFRNVQVRIRIRSTTELQVQSFQEVIYCLSLTVVTFTITLMYVNSTYRSSNMKGLLIQKFSFYEYGTGASIEGSGFIQ
jgi:hypothetical protein